MFYKPFMPICLLTYYKFCATLYVALMNNYLIYAVLAIVAAVLLALNQRWCAKKTKLERIELALKYALKHPGREFRD